MADEMISFARGAPSADILPIDAVREAAQRALGQDGARALSYGPGAGHAGLRELLAERHEVSPDQVMITNGSLEGAAMLFEHVVAAGDRVVVEQPTYDRTLLLLRHRDAELTGVALEGDGLVLDALDEATGDPPPKLVHVIPNFHNPAGCTLSAEKRGRVLELAAERGFTVFEDDPYLDIHFDEAPPPTMLSRDEGGSVVYASSFSKTVSPGIRVGYLVGPAALISTLAQRANETRISPNMLVESIVWDMAKTGALERNVSAVNDALRERRDALCASLSERIPDAEYVVPGGGYFLWADLPDDVDTAELQSASREEGAVFVKGADFMIEGGDSSLRFSFASVPADQVDEGVARIARGLERVRAG